MEAAENNKRSYDNTFKGIHKQHINKRRRKKENLRKLNERKRKRTEKKKFNELMESVLETR